MSGDVVLVGGGGGFIGGHLVASLLEDGHRVRSVDLKPVSEWYQVHQDAENVVADLRVWEECERAVAGTVDVYNLAADMGGMGFIENNKALCMLSVLINTHLLQAAREAGVKRFFYSSSACVYAADKQTDPDVTALEGERRLPGHARGRLRLGEALQRAHVPPFPRGLRPAHARRPLPQRLRAARHLGRRSREGARRDLPQGRSEAKLSGNHEIEIWGDGEQTRSFMYIDDCLKGMRAILDQRHPRADEPRVERDGHDQSARRHRRGDRRSPAGTPLRPRGAEGRPRAQQRQHDDPASASAGSRTRHCDDGLERTYAWIYEQVAGVTAAR